MTAATSALARNRLIARGHCSLGRQFSSRTSLSPAPNLSIPLRHIQSNYNCCRATCGSCNFGALARHSFGVRSAVLSNTGTGPRLSDKSLDLGRHRLLLSQGAFRGDLRKHHSCAASDAAIVKEEFEKAGTMAVESLNVDIKEAVSVPNTRVVVRDQEALERKKHAIRAAGPQKLQVVSDFDMTLTRFNVNGKKGQSCHSLLSQRNDQYNQMRQELYKHYYPLEIDQSIPYDKKVKLMEEWYEKSHATLLEGGLTLDEIRDSVANANVAFREETAQLFELLDSKRVPVLIFSAGLADVLEEVLRQKLHRAFGNIRVVSNRMKFDEAGRLQSFVGSLIHSLNKNEHAIALAGPMHDEQGRALDDLEHREPSDGSAEPAIDGLDGRSVVAGRNNVILLGDHLGDLGMSRGVDVDEQISIAFLNDKVEDNLEVFANSFDVVLLGDGSMKEVISIVEDIL